MRHVRRMAARLDNARVELVRHHLELRQEFDASAMVATAEVAVANMERVLEQRKQEVFIAPPLEADIPASDALRELYLDACTRVQRVDTSLCSTTEVFLRDEGRIPSQSAGHVSVVQRRIISEARALLARKTRRYLRETEAFFNHGTAAANVPAGSTPPVSGSE